MASGAAYYAQRNPLFRPPQGNNRDLGDGNNSSLTGSSAAPTRSARTSGLPPASGSSTILRDARPGTRGNHAMPSSRDSDRRSRSRSRSPSRTRGSRHSHSRSRSPNRNPGPRRGHSRSRSRGRRRSPDRRREDDRHQHRRGLVESPPEDSEEADGFEMSELYLTKAVRKGRDGGVGGGSGRVGGDSGSLGGGGVTGGGKEPAVKGCGIMTTATFMKLVRC